MDEEVRQEIMAVTRRNMRMEKEALLKAKEELLKEIDQGAEDLCI